MTAPTADSLLDAVVHREKLQYHRLRPATYRDPHGRRWSTQVNTDTLHPATTLTPLDWAAPHALLVPPAKYLRVSEVLGELGIDYDRWLADVTVSRRDYEQHVMHCARQLFNAGAVDAIKRNDPDLRALAGVGPMSPEFVRAMKANLVDPTVGRWPLGLPGTHGQPLPMPRWAVAEWQSLQVIETYDGSDVDTTLDVTRYADDEAVDEDAQAAADRLEAQLKWQDDEDALMADPEPNRRVKVRRPKE